MLHIIICHMWPDSHYIMCEGQVGTYCDKYGICVLIVTLACDSALLYFVRCLHVLLLKISIKSMYRIRSNCSAPSPPKFAFRGA